MGAALDAEVANGLLVAVQNGLNKLEVLEFTVLNDATFVSDQIISVAKNRVRRTDGKKDIILVVKVDTLS